MTKAELVEDVARAAELTKKDAERLVEIVFESIIETLNQGEKIELRGFGSFRVRERGARRGRNPKTGDPVSIPAKRVPYFKPGKELNNSLTTTTAHLRRRQTLHVPSATTIANRLSSKLQWIDCGAPGVPGTSRQALMHSARVVCFA